jgi:hypothetical protein
MQGGNPAPGTSSQQKRGKQGGAPRPWRGSRSQGAAAMGDGRAHRQKSFTRGRGRNADGNRGAASQGEIQSGAMGESFGKERETWRTAELGELEAKPVELEARRGGGRSAMGKQRTPSSARVQGTGTEPRELRAERRGSSMAGSRRPWEARDRGGSARLGEWTVGAENHGDLGKKLARIDKAAVKKYERAKRHGDKLLGYSFLFQIFRNSQIF